VSLTLLKSKRCLGDPYAAPPYRAPCATSRTPARSLYNTSSAQPATLSLNVQSFQSTTFNGERRIYGYHPLTSRAPLRPSDLAALRCFLLRSRRSKLALREALESRSKDWLCAESKTILWERNGPRNFICPRATTRTIVLTFRRRRDSPTGILRLVSPIREISSLFIDPR